MLQHEKCLLSSLVSIVKQFSLREGQKTPKPQAHSRLLVVVIQHCSLLTAHCFIYRKAWNYSKMFAYHWCSPFEPIFQVYDAGRKVPYLFRLPRCEVVVFVSQQILIYRQKVFFKRINCMSGIFLLLYILHWFWSLFCCNFNVKIRFVSFSLIVNFSKTRSIIGMTLSY